MRTLSTAIYQYTANFDTLYEQIKFRMNNNTYFNTNFVFKIDNSSNFNNEISKGSSCRKSPIKRRSKNFKKYFDLNSNYINIT